MIYRTSTRTMVSRSQLLLPVNPAYLWGSLLCALAFNMVPFGRVVCRPDVSWR